MTGPARSSAEHQPQAATRQDEAISETSISFYELIRRVLMTQLTAVLDREQEIARQALKEGNKVRTRNPSPQMMVELITETSIDGTAAKEIPRIVTAQD